MSRRKRTHLDQLLTNLSIREANPGDAAALAGLMCELSYETTESEMAKRLRSIMGDPHYQTFVAVSDGQVCGMIGTFAGPSHEHNDLSGRIVALVVSKAMRRRGIARRLIQAAEEDFSRRKVTRVALTTRLTRKDAHRFYEELGYERNGFRYASRREAIDVEGRL
jgi:ribosomal protein S18 acetylase RimI-like enzyme